VHDSPRTQLNHEEDEGLPEQEIHHRQEVAGPNVLGVCLEEGRPGLTRVRRRTHRTDVFLNRAFRHGHPELQKLPLNALGSPKEVLFRQLLDEVNCFLSDFGFIRLASRFSFPEKSKTLAMSMEQGVRLDDQESLFPMCDSGREVEQPEAVPAIEPRSTDLALEN
jgi:hypothetical protein